MNNNQNIQVGDLVQFNTICIWDKCSGIVHEVGRDLVGVTLPDGKTKLAFGYYEVIKQGGIK